MKKTFFLAIAWITTILPVCAQFYVHPSNGRVGLGNTAPAGNLHLTGTSTSLILEKSTTSYESVIQFRRGATVLFTVGSDVTSDAFKIRATGLTGETNLLPRLEMPFSNKNIYLGLSGGFVGINTNTPSEVLDINGGLRIRSAAQDNTLNRILAIDANGKLFWKDAATFPGGDNMGNHIALQSIVPSTTGIFDLGSSSLQFADLHLAKSVNIGGVRALSLQGSNILSVGVGGSFTVGDPTTVYNNVFIGSQAGINSFNAGANDVFVGHSAGLSNAGGDQNVFIGNSSGLNSTSGDFNTFVGNSSGKNNGSGSYNTFLGYRAGSNAADGSRNVLIGFDAASQLTSGSNNCFVGFGTAPQVSTSNYNTSLGHYSGPSGDGLSYTTALGYGAMVGVNYGVVLGGNQALVGIRNTNPAYALHVQNAYCDGNTWFNSSDRNLKENFTTLADENVLDKIMRLKIQKWNYIGDAGAAHIGPTAQDFYETFKLGSNEKVIASVDEAGVALAAIQELNLKTQKLEQIIQQQQEIISSLLKQKNLENGTETATITNGLKIFQNNPNPFNKETKISMQIPEKTMSAVLYIYDMNGKALEQHTVTGRGNTSLSIEGGKFSSGIYLYAIVADGESSEIKRMILTE